MSALDFERLFPAHAAGLHLSHNDHKGSYMSVEEHLLARRAHDEEFVAPGERERAIATDELWELQWYQDTPVSFRICYAASFGALVAWLEMFQDPVKPDGGGS